MNKINKNEIAVIDLFCGIGGISHGFVQEGFNVVAGYDNEVSCKYAFETNNNAKFYNEDISKLQGAQLNEEFGDKFKILVGCAPCQPFSSYSYKLKEKDPKKLNLLYSFARLVEETKPMIVAMENVPQLLKNENFDIFNTFNKKLILLGYKTSYSIVYCPDYGIPQKRRRLIFLASKLGDITIIPPTHRAENYVTVRDTIGGLNVIEAGETDKQDPLHRSRILSDINIQRIKHTTEGGGWKEWPDHLVLECFKKDSGRSYGSVYGRMKWDEPSPTMTTHCTGLGNGRYGHPEQNRAISLREAALLQTFPIEYQFFAKGASYNSSAICKQIGNAVPPKLGQVIAKSIKIHLKKSNI